MKEKLEIFIDRACQGNPGESAVGVAIYKEGKIIKEISQAIGYATNNIAEYSALIYGLQEALILKADEICINTDSELLFYQLEGRYKIKNPNLKFLFGLVEHLKTGFEKIDMRRIPREENSEADSLASRALLTVAVQAEQRKSIIGLPSQMERLNTTINAVPLVRKRPIVKEKAKTIAPKFQLSNPEKEG